MQIDHSRLQAILTIRDDRHARLLAASARLRDENARRWQAVKSVEALEVKIAETAFAAEREGLGDKLTRSREALAAAQSRVDALTDDEARLRDEWTAAARLAEAVEAHAAARGVKIAPVPIIGPDHSLAQAIAGVVHG